MAYSARDDYERRLDDRSFSGGYSRDALPSSHAGSSSGFPDDRARTAPRTPASRASWESRPDSHPASVASASRNYYSGLPASPGSASRPYQSASSPRENTDPGRARNTTGGSDRTQIYDPLPRAAARTSSSASLDASASYSPSSPKSVYDTARHSPVRSRSAASPGDDDRTPNTIYRSTSTSGRRGPTLQDRVTAASATAHEAERLSLLYKVAQQEMTNRRGTEVGLLLLRVATLPLILHAIWQVQHFTEFTHSVAQGFGPGSASVVGYLVIAGEIALPVLLAVGLLARPAALLLAVEMVTVWLMMHSMKGPVLAASGGVSNENVLLYALLAAPLIFSGGGKYALDFAVTREWRERKVDRRADELSEE